MIEFKGVTFGYGSAPVLSDVDLRIEPGELAVVSGHTGSGKSTLLRMINALVPQFSGGELTGDVRVDGASVVRVPPRELAHVVGFVPQDPLAGFVTDIVEDELAYGMEQLGVGPATMRRRVEETLDLLGISDLRRRSLRTLSGGQQQRVAIGAVLTSHPQVVVLDEPTSALDPTAAEDVLATIARLVHDLAITVVLAEHRLERVVPFADRLVVVDGGRVRDGAPDVMLRDSPVAPPLVELGRVAGWEPLPLSVREARRRAPGLRAALGEPPSRTRQRGEPLVEARGVEVAYGASPALRGVDLQVAAGEIVVVMGRNGSGKSTLLWAVQGSGRRSAGGITVAGTDPASVPPARRRALVGLVPQTAADLLYLESVGLECASADEQAGAGEGTCRALLDALAPGIDADAHPRDLSEGQRLALVLAIVVTSRPRVVALDEPTRGLDYGAKAALATTLRGLAGQGHGVLLSTHDVEFAAMVADTVVVLADGEVVSTGEAAQVLAESPAFAPQVAKVLGDGWLTVDDVREALS